MITRKAILISFDINSYSADVMITGSGKAKLDGIRTARNIPASEMVPGCFLVIVFWDKNNARDAVITAVY